MHTIKLFSVLFGVVVHAAGAVINKIHWSTTAPLTVYCWSQSTSHPSESQILVENRDFCLPHLHSKFRYRRVPSEYCH